MQFAFEPTSDAAGDQQWMMRVGGNPIQIIVIYAAILMSGGVEIVILQNDRNIEYIYIYINTIYQANNVQLEES